jgi:hypothetical protein
MDRTVIVESQAVARGETEWAMNPHQREEYISLRKEIETLLADLSGVERNCLLAVAAVYVWLTSSETTLSQFDKLVAWGVPFLLVLFSALRSYSINQHLGVIGEYVRGIEKLNKPGGETAIGWETFFQEHGRGIQTRIRMWFWGALLVFTLVAWVLRGWCGFQTG